VPRVQHRNKIMQRHNLIMSAYLVVFVNEVQATVVGDECCDLLACEHAHTSARIHTRITQCDTRTLSVTEKRTVLDELNTVDGTWHWSE
jgi:hypothetical protein